MDILDKEISATSKAQAGSKLVKSSVVYDLCHKIELIQVALLDEMQAKSIDLSLVFTGDMPVVYWELCSLRSQAFNNILSCSIRNTPVGGKIKICVKKLDDYRMSIKISESGQGIPETEREYLFHRTLKT